MMIKPDISEIYQFELKERIMFLENYNAFSTYVSLPIPD